MPDTISIENFRALVENAGLNLTDQQLEALKPMYEHYLPAIEAMRSEELGPEDLAIVYNPGWDPQSEATR
ncbi:MAG: hypothetical protein ACRDIB_05625 [Ardenticatenaceae bacterium]